MAKETGAIPYDAPGAELHHFEAHGHEYVSFDAIIRKYRLTDPALLELAKIVRRADGGSGEAPEAAGLEAAALGFRRAIVPRSNVLEPGKVSLDIHGVATVGDALTALLG